MTRAAKALHADAPFSDRDRKPGDPPFAKLRYCTRCCMPKTNEGMAFGELGICKACESSEQKMRINWHDRREALAKILDKAKAKDGVNYDCVAPISGGKDSAFQLHILVKLTLRFADLLAGQGPS